MFSILLGLNYILSDHYLQTSLAWVTVQEILSPASTALQIREAHKRFHQSKVVVRGNELMKYHSRNYRNLVNNEGKINSTEKEELKYGCQLFF